MTTSVVAQQEVKVSSAGVGASATSSWTAPANVNTPDLMGIFEIVQAQIAEQTTDAPPPKPISAEDVAALMDWLLSESLDWDAVERARSEGWQA